MTTYNLIAATSESTVVAEYTPEGRRSDSYQSEAALEQEFIRLLQGQGYEYLSIHSEGKLVANLRRQLELLNDYSFTDSEWDRFFKTSIAGANDGILEKTRRIQTDHVQVLRQDSGTSKNIYLLDKKHIHNNRLQVINQYEESEGRHDTRYDVTILVNGLPLVHVELKRRGVAIREAFNQIKRYQRDSFWAASGLYEYVQIFVISNGTNTKYYSNTTRNSHIKEQNENRNKSKKTSNSFLIVPIGTFSEPCKLPGTQADSGSCPPVVFYASNRLISSISVICFVICGVCSPSCIGLSTLPMSR